MLFIIVQPIHEIIRPYLLKVPVNFSPTGCIVIAFLLVIASRLVHTLCSFLLLGNFDIIQTEFRYGKKDFEQTSTWARRIVKRAYWAYGRQWEGFTAFAIAMLMGVQSCSGVQYDELILLGNAFILNRIAFNVAAIAAFNAPLSIIRVGLSVIALAIIVRIFVIAVNDLQFYEVMAYKDLLSGI
jgi:hypothetical protein